MCSVIIWNLCKIICILAWCVFRAVFYSENQHRLSCVPWTLNGTANYQYVCIKASKFRFSRCLRAIMYSFNQFALLKMTGGSLGSQHLRKWETYLKRVSNMKYRSLLTCTCLCWKPEPHGCVIFPNWIKTSYMITGDKLVENKLEYTINQFGRFMRIANHSACLF